MNEHRNSLAVGYRLHWYVIKRILGQGGFGITYLAEDTNLGQLVAIKEYLPIDMAVREDGTAIYPVSGEYGQQFDWGLDRFITEARTLAKFKHPNIVRVFTVFQENNTAYMVMEYEKGEPLHTLLKDKATMDEEKLKNILFPILEGLRLVHDAGFIHRDIKPANIFIRENGAPVLLDFGSARQALGEHTRTLTNLVSPGFAPFEQYTGKSDKQGPWTDLYGLAATMYRAVIGVSPADAMDRSESLLHQERDSLLQLQVLQPEGYSAPFLAALDAALAFRPEDRPRSISDWQRILDVELPLDQELVHADEAVTEEAGPVAAPAGGSTTEPGTVKITMDASGVAGAGNTDSAGRQPVPKRFVKYGLAALLVLFLLSVIGNRQEQQRADDDAEVPPLVEAISADPGHLTDTVTGEPVQAAQSADVAGPVVTDVPVAAVKTAPDGTPQDGIPETTVQGPAAQDSYLSAFDSRRYDALLEKLEKNPDDRRARAGLRALSKKYEKKVRDAIKTGDFGLAHGYVSDMLKKAPQSKRLQDALAEIEKKRRENTRD